MLPELPDRIPPEQKFASVTADGAFDTRKCHDAIAARGAAAFGPSLEPVAFVPSLPPRKNAKPWKPDTAGAVGFGNWMRHRCNEAGLPNRATHGLRKACARRLAEADCTLHQIKAITGHKTDAEVHRYTAKANQVLLAHSAFEKLQDTANNPKAANPL